MEGFNIIELGQFFTVAGKKLYQLHLHTRPDPGYITPLNLPHIVGIVRTQAPKLVDFRIPINFSSADLDITDKMMEPPDYSLTPGPGTVQRLSILVYNLSDDEQNRDNMQAICSWNFARNLACLLAPTFKITLTLGPTTDSGSTSLELDHMGMPFLSWYIWHDRLKAAVEFFQRSDSRQSTGLY